MQHKIRHYVYKEGRKVLAALSYFTAFPVHFLLPRWSPTPLELKGSLAYLSFIGLGIGVLVWFVYWGTLKLWAPPLACLVASISGVVATWALHEDGLADAFDGFGGAFDKDSILKIMKDSRHGTYGVLALWSVMALKWQFMVHTAGGPRRLLCALIVAHGASRVFVWFVAAFLPDARKDQEGEGLQKSKVVLDNTYRQKAPVSWLWLPKIRPAVEGMGLQLLIIGGLAAYAPAEMGLLSVMAPICFWGVRCYLLKRLGGYTGDCLGACQQGFEIAVYAVFAAR